LAPAPPPSRASPWPSAAPSCTPLPSEVLDWRRLAAGCAGRRRGRGTFAAYSFAWQRARGWAGRQVGCVGGCVAASTDRRAEEEEERTRRGRGEDELEEDEGQGRGRAMQGEGLGVHRSPLRRPPRSSAGRAGEGEGSESRSDSAAAARSSNASPPEHTRSSDPRAHLLHPTRLSLLLLVGRRPACPRREFVRDLSPVDCAQVVREHSHLSAPQVVRQGWRDGGSAGEHVRQVSRADWTIARTIHRTVNGRAQQTVDEERTSNG
jgi:hypothetical protein